MFGMLWVVLTFLVKESVQCKWHGSLGPSSPWLRGRGFAIPTLDRRLDASTIRLILTRQRASCLMVFFSTECLPWIQISQDFIGLGFAAGTIQGDHALFACASLYVLHVQRVWGEEMPCSWCIFLEICEKIGVRASSLASVSSNGPTNLDPKNANQSAIWTSAGASGARGVIATVKYDASLVLSIALAGAGSSTLTNIYIC